MVRYYTLGFLESFFLWTIRKETAMNESSNVRLQAESWTYWKNPLKQDKRPYKWSTIEYNSINTETSENIF